MQTETLRLRLRHLRCRQQRRLKAFFNAGAVARPHEQAPLVYASNRRRAETVVAPSLSAEGIMPPAAEPAALSDMPRPRVMNYAADPWQAACQDICLFRGEAGGKLDALKGASSTYIACLEPDPACCKSRTSRDQVLNWGLALEGLRGVGLL